MTHFRAVSELEGAANLVEIEEDPMFSYSSDEDEGGFTVAQLERWSSRTELGIVKNLLSIQPIYIRAICLYIV